MARGNRLPWLVDASAERLLNQARLTIARVRVLSYPRSGRTWLRLMLHDLCVDPRFTHAGAKKMRQSEPSVINADIPAYRNNRILFLLRDPRDTVVSHYHHCIRQKSFAGTLPDFVRGAATGFERILAFNTGWLEAHASFKGFGAVCYEDLRETPNTHLKAIVGFLGSGRSDDASIAATVAAHDFENMRRKEQSGELHGRFGNRFTASGDGDNQRIVRRGQVSSHEDELAPAEQDFCRALLARYDYEARIASLLAETALVRAAREENA